MTTQNYQVTGMSCHHCEMSVTEEVSEIPGVNTVDVSAQTGKLTITADHEIDDAQVLAAVDEAGFSATRA